MEKHSIMKKGFNAPPHASTDGHNITATTKQGGEETTITTALLLTPGLSCASEERSVSLLDVDATDLVAAGGEENHNIDNQQHLGSLISASFCGRQFIPTSPICTTTTTSFGNLHSAIKSRQEQEQGLSSALFPRLSHTSQSSSSSSQSSSSSVSSSSSNPYLPLRIANTTNSNHTTANGSGNKSLVAATSSSSLSFFVTLEDNHTTNKNSTLSSSTRPPPPATKTTTTVSETTRPTTSNTTTGSSTSTGNNTGASHFRLQEPSILSSSSTEQQQQQQQQFLLPSRSRSRSRDDDGTGGGFSAWGSGISPPLSPPPYGRRMQRDTATSRSSSRSNHRMQPHSLGNNRSRKNNSNLKNNNNNNNKKKQYQSLFLIQDQICHELGKNARKENDAMVYLDGPRIYTCGECRTHLTSHDEIISKSFHGSNGRAYLFDMCVNVNIGPAEDRRLITGLHSVSDIYCKRCNTLIGWTYARAYEPSQKYKEGKFIIEKIHLFMEESDRYQVNHPAGERRDKWKIRSMSWGEGGGGQGGGRAGRDADSEDGSSTIYEYRPRTRPRARTSSSSLGSFASSSWGASIEENSSSQQAPPPPPPFAFE